MQYALPPVARLCLGERAMRVCTDDPESGHGIASTAPVPGSRPVLGWLGVGSMRLTTAERLAKSPGSGDGGTISCGDRPFSIASLAPVAAAH